MMTRLRRLRGGRLADIARQFLTETMVIRSSRSLYRRDEPNFHRYEDSASAEQKL